MSWPCRIVFVRFSTLFLDVTSLVKYDSYGIELCVLVIMMAELRFYLKYVDFRSDLALRVADWSHDIMLVAFSR